VGAYTLGRSDALFMSLWGRKLCAVAVCGLAILLTMGCSDSDDQGCAAACLPIASFTYATAKSGSDFTIALSPRGATIRCELTDSGEARCEPNVGGYQLGFGRDGLRSIKWSTPPRGALHVEVTIDGNLVTSQGFNYDPSGNGDACSGGCAPDPQFELE
jgi:hypothetical protein